MEDQVKWSLDQGKSEIGFNIRYMIFWKLKGGFKNFSIHITSNDGNLQETKIKLVIDTNSITTKSKRLDDFLRSYELLNTLSHEHILFESIDISNPDEFKLYQLLGKLTIKNKTKPVEWKIQMINTDHNSWNSPTMCMIIKGTINRKIWLIGEKTFIGKRTALVSRKINIFCKLELSRMNQRALDTNLQQGIGKSASVYSRTFNRLS